MSTPKTYDQAIAEYISKDSEFAIALLETVFRHILNGEPAAAQIILRSIVNGTIGFEKLSILINKPSKSIHRMLSANGNPTTQNLSIIINAIRENIGIEMKLKISN